MLDHLTRIGVMRLDVHAGEIRDEHLEAILLGIENHAALLRLIVITEALGAEEDPEFERHVESGQIIDMVEFCAGEVMNAVPTLSDDPVKFVNPSLGRIIHLAGASRTEAAGEDSEDERLETDREGVVKRTVYENVARGRWHGILSRVRVAIVFDGLVRLSAGNFSPLGHRFQRGDREETPILRRAAGFTTAGFDRTLSVR